MRQYISPVIRLFLRDRIVRWLLLPAAGVSVLWLVILFWLFPRGESIPLHYNVTFGIDFIGAWYEIFLLPLAGLVLTALNGGLSLLIWRRDRTMSYLLLGGNAFVSSLITVSTALIVILSREYAG